MPLDAWTCQAHELISLHFGLKIGLFVRGKAYDPSSLSLRDEAYFQKHDIELKLGCEVKKLDAASKTLHLAGGELMPGTSFSR